MTSRLSVVAIDARDPGRVADFWAAALGWDAWPAPDDGGVSLAPAGSSGPAGIAGPSIDVLPVPEAKTVKNRLHFDLRAEGSTQAEEVERLLALGATRVDVGQQPDVSWIVLADPEGNEFCVLQRSMQDIAVAAPPGEQG